MWKNHKYILWQHDFVKKFYFSPHKWLEFLFLLFLFFHIYLFKLEFPEGKSFQANMKNEKLFERELLEQKWQTEHQ